MSEQLSHSGHTILNGLAEGAIGPEPRIGHDLTREQVDALVERLAGDALFSEVEDILPHKCVDGRPRADGKYTLGPDAAGGTESSVVGDALTEGRFWQPGEKASEHTARVVTYWRQQGQRVGGHDADAAHGGSGCGACDKLEPVLDYIGRRGAELRTTIKSLGVEIDDETHRKITENAQKLVANHYADGGPAIVAALREAGSDAVETLTGDHKEVAVVINTKPGTTLDRAKLHDAFGDNVQAFNVDVWALQKSAEIVCGNDAAEAPALLYATLCYNVAVAAVLSGPSLRIVVR